ncbi:MAG: type I-U CRISPR-associated helicase/endonuclease Cas3 [Gammaproteobacteria bacterium]|nr:type I-U CRISPR-associated helicase/endonuclease Cas3 [Gammaproteobacteria bacterium]MCY4281792.1 type I-U CRISPR-associated helicase/endonuclease Cas3 [Gammaproteobacteria bacterium]MCY4337721.1 type I-U CRISPR-associated helicase/endonuclease Cas3 [Gammaproteobacteria bacterium]
MSPVELGLADFPEFFTALWGEDKPPFAWQQQLANRVLGDVPERAEDKPNSPTSEKQTPEMPWPGAIALPTASGKTACMDIALFSLASQAGRMVNKQILTAPRRIFFVVDRRVIVDEAYARAQRLVGKLEQAKEGILKCVADNLRIIASGQVFDAEKERPLQAHLLRGGMYRSEAWARNPLQPMIVASTVDQVGSRLLFRAYGRGSGIWPIYAGLVANDSLILLDEAHCARPFLQTLQAVQRYQTWAHEPLSRPFYPVVMSATPPPGITDVFEDLSEEKSDPEHPLGRRYKASKPAKLGVVKGASRAQAITKLAKSLTEAAIELINEERRAVVVFVNRVATAREAARLLRCRPDRKECVTLLTGRMRPVDKEVVQQHLEILRSDQSAQRALSEPYIVVATQTLEVGADLDFDGLVSECASLDSLRQRFGRLNRTGRDIEAKAAILVQADQADTKKNEGDPVYGAALSKTWEWLQENKNENDTVDFGIASLEKKLPAGDTLAELNAPSVNAPVMLPAHVDCWAQTSPTPNPSPDVALFLHGPREGAADVQVCWRADLNLTNDAGQKEAIEVLFLCPPSSSESLSVPFKVFKHWLAGSGGEDNSADLEGAQAGADIEEATSPVHGANVILWRGPETKQEHITADPADIRPGDVIVIPVGHPHPRDQLGDLPEGANPDVGDRAYRLNRAKPILRLHRELVNDWPVSDQIKQNAHSLLNDLQQRHDEDPDEIIESLRELLSVLINAPEPSWLSGIAAELIGEFPAQKLEQACHIISDHQIIIRGRRLIPEPTSEADSFSDEDDVSASGISHPGGQPVRLRTHLPGVESFARRHATACGLPGGLVEAVARAGLLHDVGKADPRFQSLLHGGSPLPPGEPLAKSARMSRDRNARKNSEYPTGGRHELLSVRMAESAPTLLPENQELRDLVLHLVASHHGYCRPFAPVVIDKQGMEAGFELRGHHLQWRGATDLERLDSGIADRYWSMVRRYGWWGLAWLEALLRLADWRRSEWEETHNDADE